MATGSETAALVALLRLGRRRETEIAALVERAGSAIAVLKQELGSAGRQTTLLAPDERPLLEEAGALLDGWAEQGIVALTVLDAEYPANLREVHDRPALVFVAGVLTAADVRSIAVIGARRATDEGRELAARFASGFVEAGYTVVSGLAAGIDTAAHTAALDHGGRTIAVIGTGLERSYPPQNAGLQRRLAREGAVVSPFWPEAPPTKRSFPRRNGVMSALSRGSVIIEASERSGARVQARLALAHGRPVFLLERLLDQAWARELASRPGASVVASPDEVITAVDTELTDARKQE
jgi:DNA processing protein